MDALLILGGLLLVVAGLIWLVLLAFGTSLLWGTGSLVPPITMVFAVRHWVVARKAVGLSALGFIPLVVGFTMLASHDPERMAAIARFDWHARDEQASGERLAIALQGELDGRAFQPQIGEFADGVLTLREGDELFARQAVSIRLGDVSPGNVRIDVLPQDARPVPEVEINWMRPGQALPEARKIRSGYTLHLDLQPVPPNRLAGDFHLVLPAHYQTSLSGRVELYTDGLRYRDGRVDLSHDSADTLRYLVTDYLQRRFGTRDVQVTTLSPASFPAASLALEVEAEMDGAPARLSLDADKSNGAWAVSGDEYPPLPAIAEASRREPDRSLPAEAERYPATPEKGPQSISLDQLVGDPARFTQRQVRAHTRRGGIAEGRFVGFDAEGNLAISRRLKGPGEATYTLAPAEIAELELIDP